MAARVWLGRIERGQLDPATVWPITPADTGWPRTGWEVVAELAAQSVEREPSRLFTLVERLAEAHPEQAARCWKAAGSPALPQALRQAIHQRWLQAMTDVRAWPQAHTRAAIGRALGLLGLDDRRGVGVDAHTGTPDIAWVPFVDSRPWRYQSRHAEALPPFEMGRYLVTHAQFQAFVDAADGYRQARWWDGLVRELPEPSQPRWSEANSPRDGVDWFEAVAFCRWLGHRLGDPSIGLPTEQQWERVAAGRQGWAYPSSKQKYVRGFANTREERPSLGRSSAVGLYPHGASRDGRIEDLVGNLWEWCLNEFESPQNTALSGGGARVLRGGSWNDLARFARASVRRNYHPGGRGGSFGFRVCRASPIEPLDHGAAGH